MIFGYNTNGFAHHDLADALEMLAEIGYRGVGITIDHGALSPQSEQGSRQLSQVKKFLEKNAFQSVIETGARFLLDPRHKHEPTLVSLDPRPRIDFYKYAIDCARELGSDCVSIWSGGTEAMPPVDEMPASFLRALDEVLAYADRRQVNIGFEPEPGMLIDNMRLFERLLQTLQHPRLRLTLDMGHLQCSGETLNPEIIHRWAPRLVNVHIEDMRRGRHEHLMFGEGEIDFPPVLKALAESGYTGGVYVELPRHSHEAPVAARRAFEFLRVAAEEAGVSFGKP